MQLSSVIKLATLLSFVAAQEVATATTTETQQSVSPTDTTSSPSSTTTDTSTTTTTTDTSASTSSTSVDTSATPATPATPAVAAENSTESRTIVSVSTEQVTTTNNNGSTSVDLSSRDVFLALRSTGTFFENSTTGTFTTINELTTAPPPPIFQNVTENNGNTSLVLLNSDASRPLFTQTNSVGSSLTYFIGAGVGLNAYGGAIPGALIAAVFGLLW